jgi:enamine deaminase RidA (YjgF/YER057c/UK114 family)
MTEVRGETLPMIERSNPANLHRPPGYHHVTVVQPGVTVYLAGQCPLDVDGTLVGEGDIVAQAEQVARNIESALASAGATPSDVVRAVIYVASDDRAALSDVWSSLTSSAVASAFSSAATLLGVAQLGFAGQLVEVDVTAALTS